MFAKCVCSEYVLQDDWPYGALWVSSSALKEFWVLKKEIQVTWRNPNALEMKPSVLKIKAECVGDKLSALEEVQVAWKENKLKEIQVIWKKSNF